MQHAVREGFATLMWLLLASHLAASSPTYPELATEKRAQEEFSIYFNAERTTTPEANHAYVTRL